MVKASSLSVPLPGHLMGPVSLVFYFSYPFKGQRWPPAVWSCDWQPDEAELSLLYIPTIVKTEDELQTMQFLHID